MQPPLRLLFLLVLLIISLTGLNSFAADATLAWDPSPDQDVASYQLYWGTSSGNYSNSFNVGNTTSAVVSNLVAGQTYYFVATAFNTANMESLPSNEISYTPPTPTPTPSPTPSPTPTPTPTPTPPPTPTPSPTPSPTPTPTPSPTPTPTPTPSPTPTPTPTPSPTPSPTPPPTPTPTPSPSPTPTPTPSPTPTATPTVPPGAPVAGAATNITNSGFTANWASVSGATGYRLDVATHHSFNNNSYVNGYRNLDVGNSASRDVATLSASRTYYYRSAPTTALEPVAIPMSLRSPPWQIRRRHRVQPPHPARVQLRHLHPRLLQHPRPRRARVHLQVKG